MQKIIKRYFIQLFSLTIKGIAEFCKNISRENSHRPAKKVFEFVCISVIVFDLIFLPLETTDYFLKYFSDTFFIHQTIILIFTVEYLIRIIGAEDRKKFIKSFFGIVDLLAILPFAFTLGIADTSYVRIFRLTRLFRILKLTRYSKAARRLIKAIVEIKAELLTVLTIGVFIIYVFSALIYIIEHPAQPDKVSNMFDAFWLTFVTITTLGYGDITPITGGGRFLTILFMIFSIGILIMPSSILTAHLMDKRRQEMREKKAAEKSGNQSFKN